MLQVADVCMVNQVYVLFYVMSDTTHLKSRRKSTASQTVKNDKCVEDNKDHKDTTVKVGRKYILTDENTKRFHKARDSLLSSSSGYTNYRGFLNLCVILLVMSSGRLVLENILNYGLLVNFHVPFEFISDPTAWPALLALVCTNIFIAASLLIEKRLAKNKIKETHGNVLSILNIFTALLLPAIYLWYRKANPVSSGGALSIYTCVSLKLWSYFSVNRAHRGKRLLAKTEKIQEKTEKKLKSELDEVKDSNCRELPEQVLVHYPDNLNYKDMYYFIAVPTLCYEINFPRTKAIRKRFLIKRIVEMAFLCTLWFVLIQQWMIPILQNSKESFREANTIRIVERLLKFAVPNHVCWLILFYCIFHSYFNILAEVLRFADREFYREWWNAETVPEFWKNWNIPVHNFCTRHIYKPLLSIGVTKFQSQFIVFFISAFFHEYLVSIPLRMFRVWSFLGMIMQLPFAFFVFKYLKGNYGNMAIWLSLIIGQPLAIFMYIHDYYIDYFNPEAVASF